MLQRNYQQLNFCDENQDYTMAHIYTYQFFTYFHAAISKKKFKAIAII